MQIGPVMVNCYLLVNEDDKKVIVVDPGGAVSMSLGASRRLCF